MSTSPSNNKKAKKEPTATTEATAPSTKLQQTRGNKKPHNKKSASSFSFEIPYTYPPYTGGTGLTDASSTYEEMKHIVETKTKADPDAFKNITLISLRFETGPHFGVTLQDQQAAAAASAKEAALQNGDKNVEYVPTPEHTIFVGGIPNTAREDDIRTAFVPHKIKFIDRPRNDKNPGYVKPIAFVEFFDKATADAIRGLPAGSVTITGVPVRISNVDASKFENKYNQQPTVGSNNSPEDAAAESKPTNPIDLDPKASKVCAINNLLGGGANVEAVFEWLGNECEKNFGTVINIAMYTNSDASASEDAAAATTVCVEFGLASQALACVQKMNGRMINNQILTAGLMDMNLYQVVSKK